MNDTFQEGKVRWVYVQAEDVSRATPQKLSAMYVANAKGEQIPPLGVLHGQTNRWPQRHTPLQPLPLDQD